MGSFEVHYGERRLRFELDEGRVAFDLEPADVPGVADAEAEVRRALTEPVGSPPLRELIRPGQKVVIIGDDLTRLTPTELIVPLLLDEVNAGGVPDGDIMLIIATGTHRPMTPEEIDAKYGRDVTGRVAVISHDCLDVANLVPCGVTRRGADIWVNRLALQADVRIGVGHIVPHFPAGWSGGAKILLPGVAGRHTTGQMHLLGATERPLGKVDTVCREEMEDFAREVGLDFIVNAVLNRDGELIHVAAGDFIAAHRQGVRRAEQVLGVAFDQKADLVLSSTYPIDFDLFQADKGLFSAAMATRDGGEIVLLSPCYEGVSPTHGESIELAALGDEELWGLARSDRGHDPLSIAEAVYFNAVKKSIRVTLAAEGIPRQVAEKMGFHYLVPADVPEYVRKHMAAEPDLTVGILRNSAEILPLHRPAGGARNAVV